MHRPPQSKERTSGDHFGERNSRRVEETPISPLQSTDNTSASPSTFWWRGGGTPLRRQHLPHHSQFLTKKEEFSTYPSSGLYRRDTHAEGESCTRATYFQVSVATQSVSSVEDWITDLKTVLCCISSLLYGAKSLSARSSQKGCTPKSLILSYFQLEFWSKEA